MTLTLALNNIEIIGIAVVSIIVLTLLGLGMLGMFSQFFRTVDPGTAVVRRGMGGSGSAVHFNKLWVVPVIHRAYVMDISVKRIEIYRHGAEGLNCRSYPKTCLMRRIEQAKWSMPVYRWLDFSQRIYRRR